MPKQLRQGGKYKFRFVPAGYSYLGPGNSLHSGPARNYNDGVAQDHDIGYTDLIDLGHDPYQAYNQHDEDFLNKIQPNDAPTIAAKGIFESKRLFAQAGLIPTIDGTSFLNLLCLANEASNTVHRPFKHARSQPNPPTN